MLTPAERALLFRACWDHPVAKCARCDRSFRMSELAADLFRGLSHLCASCLIDLTDAIREHLISCAEAVLLDAEHVIAQTIELRKENAAIRKDAQQLRDLARLIRAEAEAERERRSGAGPAHVDDKSDPICPGCVKPIGSEERVSRHGEDLMHEACDYVRGRWSRRQKRDEGEIPPSARRVS